MSFEAHKQTTFDPEFQEWDGEHGGPTVESNRENREMAEKTGAWKRREGERKVTATSHLGISHEGKERTTQTGRSRDVRYGDRGGKTQVIAEEESFGRKLLAR